MPVGSASLARRSPALPVQVLLEQELEQLSEELDKDMRDMETRRTPRQVPPGPPCFPSVPAGIPAVGIPSCGLIQLWAHPAVGSAFVQGLEMHMVGCTAGCTRGQIRAHLD